MTESLLRLNQLVIGYTGPPLSSPLTLEIPSGSAVGIIGTNGSGKSTLIKTLAGLVDPLSGSYEWRQGTRFGYVPQEDQLSPLIPLTVTDLLKMGGLRFLPRFRIASAGFESLVSEILNEMEMGELKEKLVSELSRGQRQRALIARALIGDPNVLLLDEPYSALDDSFRRKPAEIFREKIKKENFSFFIIEHDLNRIVNQVDWVIVFGSKQTLCGPRSEVITQESLSRAYGSKLHLHEENGETQIHFL